MDEGDKIQDMAEACLALHDAVKQFGTRAMRTLSQVLLLEIGRELARRATDLQARLNLS
jgi:hypothetical protein